MRYLISHLGEAVKLRLQALTDNSPAARLQAIVAGNFDDSQINSAAMKTGWPFGPAVCTNRSSTGCSR